MLTKEQKAQIVENLKEKLEKQKIVIITNFQGLKTDSLRELREELKKINGEYKISKKTLIKLALEKTKLKGLIDLDQFNTSIGLAFGYSDPVSSAKIINKTSKNFEQFEILGGIMDNQVLSPKDIKELANIPSKVELISKLIGSINSPLSGFINVLKGNIRGLVYVLKAIASES